MGKHKPSAALRFDDDVQDGTTSGQHGPKSKKPHKQFRQDSAQGQPSERLHQGADSSGYATRTEKKTVRRIDRASAKLERASDKPAKQKPLKKPGLIKSMRHQAGVYAHRKIHEVEHENVGIEAAHRTELTGEGAVRATSRFIKRRIRTHPARRVRKLEKRTIKAKADLQFHKLARERPELTKNPVTRVWQKQRLKRRYQKQARQAAKASAKKGAQTAAKTATATRRIVIAAFKFIKLNPKAALIIAVVFLIILLLQSCVGVVMTIGNSATGFVAASSYLAQDADIDRAALVYSEWETDLHLEILNIETARPGYDEYRYDIDDIGHNPFELMAYLTAAYHDFTFPQVEGVLRDIFNQQYTLTMSEITETRTETRTIQVGDAIGQVRTTAYCPCVICCGQWAGGPTASGVMPRANHTIAVDRHNPIVPMGTRVVINGVVYTVEDTGNLAAHNADIDIYFNTHAEAVSWGRRSHTMYLASGNSNTVEVTVTEEVRILEVTLTAQSFSNLVFFRMDAEQLDHYNLLMATKDNRQYLQSPFGETNWLPFVTSYYGYRVHPINGGKDYHKGIDIALPTGTDILAGQNGTVTFAGDSGGYGLVVVIDDGNGLVSKYAHCSTLLVSAGQTVQAGDVIARVGSTGSSTGPHLHLEVIKDGQYLNPLFFVITNDYGMGPVFGAPGVPMGDGTFAALIAEAERHLGKPYVFGASGPNSFDCSGFVCYVLNNSGVASVGRTSAQGLYNMSTPIPPSEARPGDLIFFTGTYSAPRPVTHVGFYVGNGMMIHAGKPVQYTSINTPYWQRHFYGFGRLN